MTAPILRRPTVGTPARGTAAAARGAHTAGTARGATVTRIASSARPAAAAPSPASRPAHGSNPAQQNAGIAALNRQFGMLGTSGFQTSAIMNRTNQASPQTSQPRGQSGNGTRGRGAPVGRQGRPHLRGGWLPVQGPEDRTGLTGEVTGNDSMLAEQLQNQELGFENNNSEVDEDGGLHRGRAFQRSNAHELELSPQGHQLYRSRSPLPRRRRGPRNSEQHARRRSYTPPPEQHTPMFPASFPNMTQHPQQSSVFSHDEGTGPWGAENSHTAESIFRSTHSSSSLSEQDVRERDPGAADAVSQARATRARRSPHYWSRSLDSAGTGASSQSSSAALTRQKRWSWDSGSGSSRHPSSRQYGTPRRRSRPAGRYRSVRDAFGATLRGLADLIS